MEGSRPHCTKCNTLLNSNHLVNECLRNEALSKLKEIGLELEEEHWDMETINGPIQWLTVLIKFNIWKVYASHAYGQGKISPDWFKSVLKEWLDLGFDTKEKAKERKRESR